MSTPAGSLAASLDPGRVWRVGFRPDPWAWTPWQYASDDGRFPGRWDDPDGSFRTVYAGRDLLACLLEVLARFRPDALLEEDLNGITDDADDGEWSATLRPGAIPTDWLTPREASTATLTGVFCAVTDQESLPTLREMFLRAAINLGLADLDAGALRLSAPRALTQGIARWLHDLHDGDRNLFDGVQFESRHGDGLALWAVFERGSDGEVSAHIGDAEARQLDRSHPDIIEAFRLLRLTWAD